MRSYVTTKSITFEILDQTLCVDKTGFLRPSHRLYSYVVNYLISINFTFCVLSIVTTVSFSQSTYIVNEEDRYIRPVLVLSNVSSVDVTVQIINEDITASK